MAAGDLNDGSRFGLPPIGLPQSNLNTPGSDTERRPMPGLATKNSVFAWTNPTVTLQNRPGAAAGWTDTINLRANTATGGSSTDVPTWAAGAVVAWNVSVTALGAGITTQAFFAYGSAQGTSAAVWGVRFTAVSQLAIGQIIIPLYDEPIITLTSINSALSTLGTLESSLVLIGWVRNV